MPNHPATNDPILDADAAVEARYALGKLGLVSVNTWLIIINVAVFLIATMPPGNRLVAVPWGDFWLNTATAEQRARAVVDPALTLAMPGVHGVFYHPRVDPQTVLVGPDGRPMINLRTGKPEPQIVGGVRFAERPLVEAIGHFSTGKAINDLQFWRFLTFQFLHANWIHLAFNMLGLWFIGGLVEEYLGRRRYLVFYLLCGAAGAMMYLVLNLVGYLLAANVSGAIVSRIPALLVDDVYTPLVGASAGVFGVLLAAARIAPRQIVDVAFILPMRLATAVYAFLLLAIINLFAGGSNAGGDAAHVGGALAGAYLIRNPQILRDFVRLFPERRGAVPPPVMREQRSPVEAELDRIIDKYDHEGSESLTDTERKFLHNAVPSRRGA